MSSAIMPKYCQVHDAWENILQGADLANPLEDKRPQPGANLVGSLFRFAPQPASHAADDTIPKDDDGE
jgi:hypothetical protein